MFKRLSSVLGRFNLLKMSNEQAKQIDFWTKWAMRGIVALAVCACTIVFNSMSSDVSAMKIDTSDMKGDIKAIKVELNERKDNDNRRDRAIEELQRTLNNRK